MMSFGNVELNNVKEGEDGNAAEMVVARGFASVVRHRSDEERSSVYETLLDLEEKAKQVGRGAGACGSLDLAVTGCCLRLLRPSTSCSIVPWASDCCWQLHML